MLANDHHLLLWGSRVCRDHCAGADGVTVSNTSPCHLESFIRHHDDSFVNPLGVYHMVATPAMGFLWSGIHTD